MKTLLLALLIPIQVNACLQIEGTTIDGGHREFGGLLPAKILKWSLLGSPTEHFGDRILHRRDGLRDEFTQREDDGLEEVFEGRYDKAIEIFGQLEADHPGRYGTAANMGTTYELMGNLEEALKWITEGIRRNPESHYGTEWLHVAILRAKMQLKNDSGYFLHHHIIELPDPVSKTSKIHVAEHEYSTDQIRDALQYQLAERMVFVKPLDPVVADLLFTFGVLEGNTRFVESGVGLLEMARDYGFADSALLNDKIRQYDWLIRFRKMRQIAWITVGLLVFVMFLVFAYWKKWFFLTRKAYRKHEMEKPGGTASRFLSGFLE